MNIGIYTDVSPQNGGVAQYTGLVVEAIAEWKRRHPADMITFFAPSQMHRSGLDYLTFAHQAPTQRVMAWMRAHIRVPIVRRALQKAYGLSRDTMRVDSPVIDQRASQWIRAHGTELLYFPSVTRLAVETDIPSIVAVHDTQHRRQPHFPEFASNGLWTEIENTLRLAAKRSVLMVAESETGREDLLQAYSEFGLTPDRVMVIPYTVPSYLRGRDLTTARARAHMKFDLPTRYLFYPSNFIPHKNHVGLIEALGIVRRRYGLSLALVLVGDRGPGLRKRTYVEMMEAARRVGVTDQLHYLGFVDDDDLATLYAAAELLVMPSYFGPTNLPILEAWAARCAVITADIRGIREMCQDAALLVDPGAVDDIADAIHRLWTDEAARARLIVRADERLKSFSPEIFHQALCNVLDEAARRL
ncbi:MAG: glycosyltransferase family 1 protein [Gemmatimonadetes bacterium]|nr:glycosyltransferase family 1 protein [Gemmatimonadota bacterium]